MVFASSPQGCAPLLHLCAINHALALFILVVLLCQSSMNDVHALAEMLRRRQEECRQIEAQLSNLTARSTVPPPAAAPGFDACSGDYRMSSSPSLKDHERLRSGAVPRTSAVSLGLKTEHVQQVCMLRPPTRACNPR